MKTKEISLHEYNALLRRAQSGDKLIHKLVAGLEDIQAGRFKIWKKNS